MTIDSLSVCCNW